MIDRSDPQWYRDAIIYQIHVKSFFDANNDGIGDFEGLTQRLDYVRDLGVTAIWLMPFYPSPLRDDGYDIADYRDINPSYGTMEDFKAFVEAAHERGLRVITELVINHTSRPASLVPGGPGGPPRLARARLLRLVGHRRAVQGYADHLPRHRGVELDLGPGRQAVFLAPVLQPPAGPELRQPGGAGGRHRGHALLARHGRRRAAAGRDPLPDRARRHELREPPGNA